MPLGGGGLSYVYVTKRTLAAGDDARHEYLIIGKRISDEKVILNCTIRRDFQYVYAMLTFRHWQTGNTKFGLTFQTAADASAFDKGVHMAVEDLLEGSLVSTHFHAADVGDDDVFMAVDLPVERGDSQSSSSGSSTGCGGVIVRPSVPPPGSMGLLGVVGSEMSTYGQPMANPQHYLHRMHYISRPSVPQHPSRTTTTTTSSSHHHHHGGVGSNNNNNNGGSVVVTEQHQPAPPPRDVEEVWTKRDDRPHKGPSVVGGGHDDKIEIVAESYSYVQFARDRPSVHEYSYPMVDALKGVGDAKRPEDGSTTTTTALDHGKKLSAGGAQHQPPPLLPTKSKRKREKKREKLKHLLLEQVQCKYCRETFSEEHNERGSCEDAPDCVRSCIQAVTCFSCAQCMLYHCVSDAEGDFAQHPCSCDRADDQCTRRWIGLTILSLFVPCLLCYLPLKSCHRCAVGYGICGGRHKAS